MVQPASAASCWRSWWRRGASRPDQAALAGQIPMAQDLTAEADSGGHTDNRPAITLLPTMLELRDRHAGTISAYAVPLRVGAAGGIGTPASRCGGTRDGGGVCGHRIRSIRPALNRAAATASPANARPDPAGGCDHGAGGGYV